MKNKINFKLFWLVVIFFGLLFVKTNQKVSANEGESFYGVEITRLSNIINPNNTALPFTDIHFGNTLMWGETEPTKIQIPLSGVWMIGADITTLGTGYASLGGKDNSRVILEIVKNWCGVESICPHLNDDICWERFEPQNGAVANGNNLNCIVFLEEGDEIELITNGKNTAGLLIESNPNDTGVLSPHFYAYYLGSE